MSTPTNTKNKDNVVVDAVERFAPTPPTPSTPRSSGEEAAYNVAASVMQSIILPATSDVGENPPAEPCAPFANVATPEQHVTTNDQVAEPGELDDWIQRAATNSATGTPMQPALPGTASLPAETRTRPARRHLTRRQAQARRARPARVRDHSSSERATRRFAQRPAIIAAGVLVLSVAGGAALIAGGTSGVRGQISEAAVTPPSALDSSASNLLLNPFGAKQPFRRARSNHPRRVGPRRTLQTHAATRPQNTTTAVAAPYTPPPSTDTASPAPAQTPSSTPAPIAQSAASSSPQARTGPSGPISLIGAGTTPSG
jgi:hypothetical protein